MRSRRRPLSSSHGPTKPRARHARHGRRWRHRSLVLPATAGVLTAAILITAGVSAYAITRFSDNITRIDAITPAATPAATDHPVAQNILLVGDDHRPAGASDELLRMLNTEDDGGGTNTDTMIVLHIAADGRSATMISLPRDSYVNIPGHGTNKLNSALALGRADGGDDAAGARLLIDSVQSLLGITIDHYVRVSLVGFYQIVDELGPVTVCLNRAVKDHYSGVDLPAGESTLNAQQALAFVRQRHGLLRGDLDREIRQQYFLSVEAKRLISAQTLLNPVKLSKILDAASTSIETDADLDLLTLATHLRSLDPAAIRSATIPVSGTPTITVNGAPLSIVTIDEDTLPAFVASMTGDTDLSAAASAPAADGTAGEEPAATTADPGQPSTADTTDTTDTTPAAAVTAPSDAGTAFATVPCID